MDFTIAPLQEQAIKSRNVAAMAKAVIKFLVIFITAYALLIIPENFGDAYAAFLRKQGQFFFKKFGEKGVVQFQPNQEAHKWNFPNIIIIYNSEHYNRALRTGGNYQYTRISLDIYHDFIFVTFLIALVLATPQAWQRKLTALLVSLVLMHVYINITIYIALLFTFNENAYLDVVHLSPFWTKIVRFIHPLVRVNYGTGFFVAIVIWMVACLRKEDLMKLNLVLKR